MNEYSQHIIARLKRYNRCSTPWTSEEQAEQNRKDQKTAIAGAKSDTAALIDVYTTLGKQVLDLAKTEAARATGIGKLIKVQQDLAKNMQDLSNDANILAKRNADLQKSYGLNVAAAAKMGFQFDSLAGTLGTSRENIEKNYKALRTLTGGTRANTETMQRMNQYYTVNRGLTQDMTDGLLMFAAAQTDVKKGGAATDAQLKSQVENYSALFKHIEDITKIQGAQLDIEQAIGKSTSDTRLTFSKYPAAMGLAVMKAKALGLELSDLKTIGDNLLSIESSVGEELNYQLLTGHRLVDGQGKSLTNLYREAQLRGDANKQADILGKILEDEGDTLQNNLLARQQMAKVFGMEENQLATMIEKRKLIKGLKDKDGKPLQLDSELLNKTGKELEEGLKKANIKAEDLKLIMNKDDVRDPATQTADTLKSIEANGIRLRMGSESEAVKLITDAQAGTDAMITSFGNTMAGKFDGIMESMEKRLGIQQIEREAASQEQGSISDNLQKIAEGLGGETAVISKAFKDVVNSIPGMVKDFILGTKIETMTVGTITEGVVANDAVMINDGISFNPRDKFRTINDGMTVAGTNVGGLDRYAAQLEKRDRAFEQNMGRMIANMSTAITQAIQRANLKVNIDRSFGGSSLNPRGKYGAS
jgi:hypothetical protein